MERYEEPSDDVLAWFSAQGIVPSQEQRWQIAQLEVIEGSEELIQLWNALGGSIEEKIQALSAIQERRALEGWRRETDYREDKEALGRAVTAERARNKEKGEEARRVQTGVERKAKVEGERQRNAFEQAKTRLTKQWGQGAWSTLDAEVVGVEWGNRGVRLKVKQTSKATTKKAGFLSEAASEVLGEAFKVEIVVGED